MCFPAEHLLALLDHFLVSGELEMATKQDHVFVAVDRAVLHGAKRLSKYCILYTHN